MKKLYLLLLVLIYNVPISSQINSSSKNESEHRKHQLSNHQVLCIAAIGATGALAVWKLHPTKVTSHNESSNDTDGTISLFTTHSSLIDKLNDDEQSVTDLLNNCDVDLTPNDMVENIDTQIPKLTPAHLVLLYLADSGKLPKYIAAHHDPEELRNYLKRHPQLKESLRKMKIEEVRAKLTKSLPPSPRR